MANALNWFEIPVTDFPRAKKFYETVLGSTIHEMQMGPSLMGFFPMGEDQSGVGGAIVKAEDCEPSDKGSLIYLNAGPDLSDALGRIESAGGKVIVPKTMITEEYGFFAMFLDTEGNKVGLHSMK
ncbi:MAG: VOC family protein [Ignavibacteria bacterium]|jgi:predicted enzyme related to lactoylglutathione lyase|nr:VOC family protein [Ignavibacteria bacterium]MBK6874947.1 VOC family protein [Ignavibacteria bacterium]MBK9227236.1 VOC family protein [Ignavibacteria bacterium]